MIYLFKKICVLMSFITALVICLTGCGVSDTEGESSTAGRESVQYEKSFDLGSGLKVKLTPKQLDENLLCINFDFSTDGSVFNEFEITENQPDKSGCYLVNKSTGEKILPVGDVPLTQKALYFENISADELSEYSLKLSFGAVLKSDKGFPVRISLGDNGAEANADKITLPFGNYISVDKTVKHSESKEYSDKGVDLYFSLSSENIDFDITADKSAISTGAAIGTLSKNGKNSYIYTHPVKNDESEIVLSFSSVVIEDVFSCDVEF